MAPVYTRSFRTYHQSRAARHYERYADERRPLGDQVAVRGDFLLHGHSSTLALISM